MKILLAGGGSGGPTSPLLAVYEKIKEKQPNAEFLFVGTKYGPEKEMCEVLNVPFLPISAGKWRRYFSLKNAGTFFEFFYGMFQAIKIIRKFRPNCIFAAGSFVQVPVIWAGKLFGIPSVIHQQDIVPSWSNKLCQFFAKKITVTFPLSLKHFYSGSGIFFKNKSEKIIFTGNPTRKLEIKKTSREARACLNFSDDLPVLLVLGGGTGSEYLNNLVWECLPELCRIVQVCHITGKGKTKDVVGRNYVQIEFSDNMPEIYKAADFVVCRAGLSTISELSVLGKMAIIVPMPRSHQELNAIYLEQKQAALFAPQQFLKPENFPLLIRKLMFDHKYQLVMQENIKKIMPHNAAETVADLITALAQNDK